MFILTNKHERTILVLVIGNDRIVVGMNITCFAYVEQALLVLVDVKRKIRKYI